MVKMDLARGGKLGAASLSRNLLNFLSWAVSEHKEGLMSTALASRFSGLCGAF